MIQRWQTVFLLLALIGTIVCMCLPLGSIELKGMGVGPVLYNLALVNADGTADFSYCLLLLFLGISGVLSLITIFLFKNRKLQMRLCRLNLLAVLLWYAVFAYFVLIGAKDLGGFHQAFGAYLPFISAIMQWFAHRYIAADEKLVKSMDRIR